MKTSIDNTTGQRSLFLDSRFFFQLDSNFFSTQISKFRLVFFFVREHIFCKCRLVFFTVFDVFYKFRLKYYVFNMFLLSVKFCPQRNAIQNPELEDKLFPLRETLRRNFSESKPRWKDNLTRQERTELKELKNNQTVRVLPTDKNLGSALLSTDWVKNESLSHLYDDLSYSKVTLEECYVYRDNVIKRREQLMLTYCQFLVPNVARFLRSYDHFVTPAKFYVIPKMIQLLEHKALPNTNCFLVTADVVSLYPNVEIKKALVALDFLLCEAQVPETPLLIQLARLVL